MKNYLGCIVVASLILALPVNGAGTEAVDATRSALSPGTSNQRPMTMQIRLTANV